METAVMNTIPTDVLTEVAKNGVKQIFKNDYVITPKWWYDKIVDEYTDRKIAQEAAKRLQHPDEGGITLEELMAQYGITQAEIDAIPEDAIE